LSKKTTVLFVCVHNAGRSQMAAGFLKHLAGDRIEVLSAGTQPSDQINPSAIAAMAELGIDIANNVPQVLTEQTISEADYVITMGCGDKCPFYPGKIYLDWPLTDPAGKNVAEVKPIRDAIKTKVEELIAEVDSIN